MPGKKHVVGISPSDECWSRGVRRHLDDSQRVMNTLPARVCFGRTHFTNQLVAAGIFRLQMFHCGHHFRIRR